MITTEFKNPDGSPMYNVAKMDSEERRLYNTWKEIKYRCTNKSCKAYHHYGGRGIKMSPEFTASFQAFVDYLGHRPTRGHSIDRIDNDKGYERGNIQWATKYTQMRNRRCTIWIEYEGERLCLEDWSKKTGLHKMTLYTRYRQGLRGDQLFYESPNRGREGIYVEIDGVTKNISEWARGAGLLISTVFGRYNRGQRGKDLIRPARHMKPWRIQKKDPDNPSAEKS
jgi:hypothetical protein